MFLDASTLQDLDIVPAPRRHGPTLWTLIDRTRTRIGRETLRGHLLAPAGTTDAVLALQEAHRFVADDSVRYRAVLDGSEADQVERYLSSNWQLPRTMPTMPRFRRWFRQYCLDVDQARAGVVHLLDAAEATRESLSTCSGDVLRQLHDDLAALLASPGARDLRSRARDGSRLVFDQLARETARPVLVGLLRCLGRLDALCSIGVATREHGWCYPQPSTRLRATQLTHPLLGPDAIANDLHLDDRVRVCFVTGPNMAGKSTMLKAVATAVVLAHAGSGVPAAAFEFPIVGTVFSSIDVVDDLGGGESFYLAEVRRIAALARALSTHGSAVAVVDEPFRGTNVHDAAEATTAIVNRLAAHPRVVVLVASHVAEVAAGLRDDPRVALLHFTADVRGDHLHFDFRLQRGVSTQRLGMALLRQEGVLALLEQSADAIVEPA